MMKRILYLALAGMALASMSACSTSSHQAAAPSTAAATHPAAVAAPHDRDYAYAVVAHEASKMQLGFVEGYTITATQQNAAAFLRRMRAHANDAYWQWTPKQSRGLAAMIATISCDLRESRAGRYCPLGKWEGETRAAARLAPRRPIPGLGVPPQHASAGDGLGSRRRLAVLPNDLGLADRDLREA